MLVAEAETKVEEHRAAICIRARALRLARDGARQGNVVTEMVIIAAVVSDVAQALVPGATEARQTAVTATAHARTETAAVALAAAAPVAAVDLPAVAAPALAAIRAAAVRARPSRTDTAKIGII